MEKFPFIQFFTADWIQDTQVLTLDAKGAWIDIICQLWISPTPGTRTWNRREFQTLLRLRYDEELNQMIADLSRVAEVTMLDAKNAKVDGWEECTWITISSRRILRDARRLRSRKDSNKKYNDKRTRSKRQKNDPETTDIYQKSEVRKKNKSSGSPKAAPPERALFLANLLARRIVENNPMATPAGETQIQSWAYEADRINRIDGKPWDVIEGVLEWSQRDQFWRNNVLSMGKLREKWNQLSMQQGVAQISKRKSMLG